MRRGAFSVLGSALAETAIVMSFTLLVIFGAIQIALLGFMQTQLDAATFMYSHAYSTGTTNSAELNAALGPIFPSVPLTSWSFAHNTNDADPLSTSTTGMPNFTQWGSLTDRYGGASILRSQLVQTTGSMTVSGLSALGNSVTLTAGMVEGESMVGNHDDDTQGAGYNSTTVYNSLENPISGDDQDVPPYYFAQAYMAYCPTFSFGSTCSNWDTSGNDLRSLGIAEFLKDDQTGNAGNYTLSAAPDDGVGSGGTFATMACHQRIYSDLAAAFPTVMPSPSPAAGSDWDETSAGPATVSAWGGASFQMVYSWDVSGIHGESPSSKTFANGFPTAPMNGCSASNLYGGVDPGAPGE